MPHEQSIQLKHMISIIDAELLAIHLTTTLAYYKPYSSLCQPSEGEPQKNNIANHKSVKEKQYEPPAKPHHYHTILVVLQLLQVENEKLHKTATVPSSSSSRIESISTGFLKCSVQQQEKHYWDKIKHNRPVLRWLFTSKAW